MTKKYKALDPKLIEYYLEGKVVKAVKQDGEVINVTPYRKPFDIHRISNSEYEFIVEGTYEEVVDEIQFAIDRVDNSEDLLIALHSIYKKVLEAGIYLSDNDLLKVVAFEMYKLGGRHAIE